MKRRAFLKQEDPRFDRKAYDFVRLGLDHTVKELRKKDAARAERSRHVSGPELLSAWLAGIPQYVIAGILGGGAGLAWAAEHSLFTGAIGVLVFVAAIALVVDREYPRGLFDLVMGLNRWVIRVVAYGAVMTDAYPPFLLDRGEHEPAHTSSTPTADATL